MILVDSSVWIDFFKGKENTIPLFELIENNTICINDLILAELLPSVVHKREKELVELLNSITKLDLVVNWNQITSMQILNLRNGINKVGIPDLIIAQNAIEHGVELFSIDNHFFLMEKIHGYKMYNRKN